MTPKQAEMANYITAGAVNPVAVCGTLHEMMLEISHNEGSFDAIKSNSAIRTILDHLCFIITERQLPFEVVSGDYAAIREAREAVA